MREWGMAHIELEENQILEVSLGYSEGGTNMVTMCKESRGYYVYLRTHILSDGCRTTQMIGDITGRDIKNGKILIEPAKRRGQKKYDAIWKKLDTSYVLDNWKQKEYDKIFDYIENIKEQ